MKTAEEIKERAEQTREYMMEKKVVNVRLNMNYWMGFSDALEWVVV